MKKGCTFFHPEKMLAAVRRPDAKGKWYCKGCQEHVGDY